MPVLRGLTARTDSVIGRVALGLAQKVWGADRVTRAQYALGLEHLTDIPAWRTTGSVTQAQTEEALAEELHSLFSLAGYGHMFSSPLPSTTPAVLTVVPDIPASTGVAYTRGAIRLRFDIAPEGKEFIGVQVFHAGDGAFSAPIAFSRNRLFVEFPVENMGMDSDNITFRLVAHFQDGTTAEGLSEPVRVAWDGTTLDQTAADEVLSMGPFPYVLEPQDITGQNIYGIDWNAVHEGQYNDVTESCVLAARAIIDAFRDFYGEEAELPQLGSDTPDNFNGAARYMMTIEDWNGNEQKEMDVEGFQKIYLRDVPQGTLPPPGALVVWGPTVENPYGHIAVVISVDAATRNIRVIEGNNPGNNARIYDVPDVTNMIGWMVPNQGNSTSSQ